MEELEAGPHVVLDRYGIRCVVCCAGVMRKKERKKERRKANV
jgi:hypothetical protein